MEMDQLQMILIFQLNLNNKLRITTAQTAVSFNQRANLDQSENSI